MKYEIKKQFCKNANVGLGSMGKAKWIIIHETDNPTATAKNHADYWQREVNSDYASANYVVDNNDIYQCVEDCDSAHAIGDGIPNEWGILHSNSINIEMCQNAQGLVDQETYDKTIWLVNYLVYKYGLTMKSVCTHNSVSGKYCPSSTLRLNKWDDLWYKIRDYDFKRENGEVADDPYKDVKQIIAKIENLILELKSKL